jgi:hypothetical protein
VKFQDIAGYRGTLTPGHLCRLMGVSERDYDPEEVESHHRRGEFIGVIP